MANYPKSRWMRLKKDEACPVCGHKGYCTIVEDRTVCRCMRLSNSHPSKAGGWIHRLTPGQAADVKTFTPEEAPKRTPDEWKSINEQFQKAGKGRDMGKLASSLGVTLDALDRLCIGWASAQALKSLATRCKSTGAWTFPMRNAAGVIVGMRLRTPDAFKYAVNGSHSGLFIPRAIKLRDVVAFCEGPTTCSALLSLGYHAIGRPSCNSGTGDVLAILRKFKPAMAVVFGENDDAKPLPGGKVFYPGQEGARDLLKAIHGARQRACMVLPIIGKDMRDWFKAGATKDAVDYEINDALKAVGGRAIA